MRESIHIKLKTKLSFQRLPSYSGEETAVFNVLTVARIPSLVAGLIY